MSFLKRLWNKNGESIDAVSATTEAVAPVCRHPHLAPRWGNAADMGDYSRATTFECSICKQQLTPAEATAIEAERALD
jgi:hypothetical protein